jgi:hypothetical protein
VVADSLARRPPGLRGIALEPHLSIDDLVTVSAYLNGPPIGLDRALRKGTAEVHRSLIACLISGLRRFPQHHGACYGIARMVGVPVDVYSGRKVVEPAFIRTSPHLPADWSADVTAPDTEIVFAFWSRTGHRVGGLGASPDTVVFAAGTRFRVLGVQPSVAGERPGVVFLRECARFEGLAWPDRSVITGLGRKRIFGQLRRQLAGSSTGGSAGTSTVDLGLLPELGFTPGFDATGRPYQEQPSQRQEELGPSGQLPQPSSSGRG